AEYIAAFNGSKEAVWIYKFISGLGIVPTIEEPINMDLFSLISAPNPAKVKIETRPRAAHEVSLLTTTANRVIDIEDMTGASGSSGTPSSRKVVFTEDPDSEKSASFTFMVVSPGSIYQPGWGVTNNCRLDTPAARQDIVDHIVPPGYFSELRHLPNDKFLN
nr:retrovirus-related Pol polyprotein from transposon TNT 1-94 [Tanacetum cinerariifolium]